MTGVHGCPETAYEHDLNESYLICDNGGMLILANTASEITQPQIDGTDAPAGPVIDGVSVGASLWSVGSPLSVPNDADGDFRNKNGCDDTNNNSADFTEGTLSTRRFTTRTARTCRARPAPVVPRSMPSGTHHRQEHHGDPAGRER